MSLKNNKNTSHILSILKKKEQTFFTKNPTKAGAIKLPIAPAISIKEETIPVYIGAKEQLEVK